MSAIDLQQLLNDAIVYAKSFENTGKVANYIPELSKADRNALGVCVVANNKKVYRAGDWNTPFTIQSISKVISLILALQTAGRDRVFSKVGVEPTGDAFNSIIRLETHHTHIPLNPMINAGAIAVVGTIATPFAFQDFLSLARKLCNRDDIILDENVYLSEKATGMRNRAIAYMLKTEGVLDKDVEHVLDIYFQMCSISVTAQDLAFLGSVLANDGVNIFTGERLVESWIVPVVKSIMMTCGMYDGSGEFAMRVGMPAKSGVGGGIFCTSEENFGIAVYGPSLDDKGNSVWGLKILEYLSHSLNLHYFSGKNINEYF